MGDRRETLIISGGLIVTVLLSVEVSAFPVMVPITVAAAVGGLLLIVPLRWLTAIAIVATWLVVPAVVPRGLTAELLTGYTALVLFARGRLRGLPRPIPGIVAMMAVALAIGVAVGLAEGAERSKLVLDSRGPLITVLAVVIAADAVTSPRTRLLARRTVLFVLWTSSALMLAANTVGVTLSGTVGEASLAGTQFGATRFQTTATPLALAILCGLVAIAIHQRHWRHLWQWAVPASFITLLGYSRNSLLALAVAVAVAGLMYPKAVSVGRLMRILGTVAASGLILYIASFVIPGGASVRSQYQAFQSRVIDGLLTDKTSDDISVTYREQEITNLSTGFRSAPLLGHGFGFAYQPGTGATGSFTDTTGRFYAHNLYWWLAAKTGLVGLVGFAGACLVACWWGIRRRITLSVILPALMAASWVAPLPFSSSGGGAAVFGSAVALAVIPLALTTETQGVSRGRRGSAVSARV